MKIESVEWSLGKSPDSIMEIWSVAATMEAVILVLAMDNQEDVAAALAGAGAADDEAGAGEEAADNPRKRQRRPASK